MDSLTKQFSEIANESEIELLIMRDPVHFYQPKIERIKPFDAITQWANYHADPNSLALSSQHQFFELAATEAQKTKLRLLEHKKRLEQVRGSLQFEGVERSDEWKDWRIAYPDGSGSSHR